MIEAFVDSFHVTMLVATGAAALLIAVSVALPHHTLPRRVGHPPP